MTWEEVKDEAIRQGLHSVEEHENRPERRIGCRQGFAIAKTLHTQEDYEKVIRGRTRHETFMALTSKSSKQKKRNLARYWRHTCATGQIRWVYERFKAFHEIFPVSAQAIMHVQTIMASAR